MKMDRSAEQVGTLHCLSGCTLSQVCCACSCDQPCSRCPTCSRSIISTAPGNLQAATYVPGSALEEAALCLRLSTEATPKVSTPD